MQEPRKGAINGFNEFRESEAGPYYISEERMRDVKYIAVVWLSLDIRQYDSYIMIFKKEPGKISQVAEWHDRLDGVSDILKPINELLDYYSRGNRPSIMLGIGRNPYGEQLLNDHLKRKGGYYFYYCMNRDPASGVVKNRDGIMCDTADKLNLVEGLKEAFRNTVIHPFTGDRIGALKHIVVNKGTCYIPEKEEAYILALAGAYKMFVEYPYRKPTDKDRIAQLSRQLRCPMFGFAK